MSSEPFILRDEGRSDFTQFDGIDDDATSVATDATLTDLQDLEDDLLLIDDLEIGSADGLIGSRQFVERNAQTSSETRDLPSDTQNTQSGQSSNNAQNGQSSNNVHSGQSSNNVHSGQSSNNTQSAQADTSNATPSASTEREPELPYQCRICGKRLATEAEVIQHYMLYMALVPGSLLLLNPLGTITTATSLLSLALATAPTEEIPRRRRSCDRPPECVIS